MHHKSWHDGKDFYPSHTTSRTVQSAVGHTCHLLRIAPHEFWLSGYNLLTKRERVQSFLISNFHPFLEKDILLVFFGSLSKYKYARRNEVLAKLTWLASARRIAFIFRWTEENWNTKLYFLIYSRTNLQLMIFCIPEDLQLEQFAWSMAMDLEIKFGNCNRI